MLDRYRWRRQIMENLQTPDQTHHDLALMARVLEVSHSGFYDWRQRSETLNAQRLERMDAARALHREKRGSLSSRRICGG